MNLLMNPHDRLRRFEHLRKLIAELKVLLLEWIKFATFEQLVTLTLDLGGIQSVVDKQRKQFPVNPSAGTGVKDPAVPTVGTNAQDA